MTVHSKLVSYFLLKVGEGPRKPLPEAGAVEHWLCRMLCGGELGEQGFCQDGSPMKCATADWRWNAENNLVELREQEEAWPCPQPAWGSCECWPHLLVRYWRWAWPPRAPALTFPVDRWVPSASASSLRMSPFLSFFFLLPSSLPFFLGCCCGGH